ncbi:MAG: hypothetical protein AABO57_18475 [Acidobacteriota bacterium]
MLGTELDSFSFAVVTVIDFNYAATGLIDYDSSSPSESVEYAFVISDEDGKRSWIRQPFWSEFGKELSQEVVSDSQVLFAGDDDYLFLVLASVVETMAKAKAVHGPGRRANCVPITNGNTDIERP